MKRKIVIACVISIFLMTGCGEKEKTNPLDETSNDNFIRLTGFQAEGVRTAAEDWQLDNMILAPGEGKCIMISLAQLQNEGYANPDDPSEGTWVTISRVSGQFVYELVPESFNGCKTVE